MPFVLNNSCNVFFDPLPDIFRNNIFPAFNCKYDLHIQLCVSVWHEVGDLYGSYGAKSKKSFILLRYNSYRVEHENSNCKIKNMFLAKLKLQGSIGVIPSPSKIYSGNRKKCLW